MAFSAVGALSDSAAVQQAPSESLGTNQRHWYRGRYLTDAEHRQEIRHKRRPPVVPREDEYVEAVKPYVPIGPSNEQIEQEISDLFGKIDGQIKQQQLEQSRIEAQQRADLEDEEALFAIMFAVLLDEAA